MFNFLRRRAVLALGFALIFGISSAHAAKSVSIQLSDEQRSAVVRLNDYLNSFETMQGEFTQTSPKGQVVRGVVLISKPGKMRFEYAAPSPLLIVSDGKWLTIKNKVKEKGDQFPLSSTPLRLVVAPKVDLLKETNILGIEQADGLLTLILEDKKGKLGGHLIIVFDEQNQALQQWVVVDGKGRKTTVALANLETGVTFDPKLFVVKINRKEKSN